MSTTFKLLSDLLIMCNVVVFYIFSKTINNWINLKLCMRKWERICSPKSRMIASKAVIFCFLSLHAVFMGKRQNFWTERAFHLLFSGAFSVKHIQNKKHIPIYHDHSSSYAFYAFHAIRVKDVGMISTRKKNLITAKWFQIAVSRQQKHEKKKHLRNLFDTLFRFVHAINNRLRKSFITNLLTKFIFNFPPACYPRRFLLSIANLLTSQSICSIIYIHSCNFTCFCFLSWMLAHLSEISSWWLRINGGRFARSLSGHKLLLLSSLRNR